MKLEKYTAKYQTGPYEMNNSTGKIELHVDPFLWFILTEELHTNKQKRKQSNIKQLKQEK